MQPGTWRRSDGWVRGIRIGDARTGRVTVLLPSEAEFASADDRGNIFGGQVAGRTRVKYERVSDRR